MRADECHMHFNLRWKYKETYQKKKVDFFGKENSSINYFIAWQFSGRLMAALHSSGRNKCWDEAEGGRDSLPNFAKVVMGI